VGSAGALDLGRGWRVTPARGPAPPLTGGGGGYLNNAAALQQTKMDSSYVIKGLFVSNRIHK